MEGQLSHRSQCLLRIQTYRWQTEQNLREGRDRAGLGIGWEQQQQPGQELPVALLLGQDEVSGGNVGEDPGRGARPGRLTTLVQRMVVVVHLRETTAAQMEQQEEALAYGQPRVLRGFLRGFLSLTW